ncbi:glycine zipper 2TM domain-containing protein [Thiotrichales bacterium HSG1]|nr:glycine zipper 2TM domain-containing protein [Thiotrichales bacterium HSG1]
MRVVKLILAISLITFLLGACTNNRSGRIYNESDALQVEDVEEGMVESVELATIRKDGTIIGTAGGTILGGIAASTIGGGTGKQLAAVGGAIIGGLLGHYFEQGVTDRNALKVVVRLDSGEKVVIIQEDDVLFQKGERVNVFSSRNNNTKRVSKF